MIDAAVFSMALILSCFSYADPAAASQKTVLNYQKATNDQTDFAIHACPREYFNYIEQAASDEGFADSLFAKVDEAVSFKCSPYGKEFTMRFEQHPEEFSVYPTLTRKCLRNGTWDGIAPVCAWKPQNESLHDHMFSNVYSSVLSCSQKCVKAREQWVSVGQLNTKYCPYADNNSSDHSMQVVKEFLIKFSHHVHLSLMAFNFSALQEDGYYADVKVPEQNVITNLTKESSNLLRYHGEVWLSKRANLTTQCAVTGIAAFTDIVFVQLSDRQSRPANKWIPKAKFYAVPRFISTSLDLSDSVTALCPKRPSEFRNAHVIGGKNDDGSNFTIVCNEGYKIKDPALNKHIGMINVTCRKNLEWSPYPFPVCSLEEREDGEMSSNVDTELLSTLFQRHIFNSNSELVNILLDEEKVLIKLNMQHNSWIFFKLSLQLCEEFKNNTTKMIDYSKINDYLKNNQELLKSIRKSSSSNKPRLEFIKFSDSSANACHPSASFFSQGNKSQLETDTNHTSETNLEKEIQQPPQKLNITLIVVLSLAFLGSLALNIFLCCKMKPKTIETNVVYPRLANTRLIIRRQSDDHNNQDDEVEICDNISTHFTTDTEIDIEEEPNGRKLKPSRKTKKESGKRRK